MPNTFNSSDTGFYRATSVALFCRHLKRFEFHFTFHSACSANLKMVLSPVFVRLTYGKQVLNGLLLLILIKDVKFEEFFLHTSR